MGFASAASTWVSMSPSRPHLELSKSGRVEMSSSSLATPVFTKEGADCAGALQGPAVRASEVRNPPQRRSRGPAGAEGQVPQDTNL